MNKTGLVYHSGCLKHRPYPSVPERAERVSATMDYFGETSLLDSLNVLTPEPATVDDLLRVHSGEMVDYIRGLSERGYEDNTILNSEVYVSHDTYQAALLAAGGVMLAAESVWNGEVKNCFALVRPAGHHASKTLPAGFCYFNNTAIAIEYLRDKYGLEKFAVFDWDAHCGNGTMNIFYDDPNVLTMSVHQDPHDFYPGEGFIEQIGEGEGTGYCMNIPVPPGTGDADYTHILNEFILDKIREYEPEFIFVAAGQDSHMDEIISSLMLTNEGYSKMTEEIMNVAKKVCDSRVVLTLEGGYHIKTLPQTHHRIVSTLLDIGYRPKVSGEVLDSTVKVIDKLREELVGTPLGDEVEPKDDDEGENLSNHVPDEIIG